MEPAEPKNLNQLPVGTTLGDFTITATIGAGGFGIVYLAHDNALDRTVAIKEYLPAAIAGRTTDNLVLVRSHADAGAYAAGLASFIREAKLVARFSHPALVEVHRVWSQNSTAYMAMRFYPGKTLRDLRLARSPFDPEQMRQAIVPILDALSELHAHNVIHRDVAPDNIQVSESGKPVLLDLGAARMVLGSMTQALTTVLKPGYAPIEQYADDGSMQQGPWTDVYAVGAVLFFLIVGQPPPQSVGRMLVDPLPNFDEANWNEAPTNLVAAITKALAVRAEHRFQSIEELCSALGWGRSKVDPERGSPAQLGALVTSYSSADDSANQEGGQTTIVAPSMKSVGLAVRQAAHSGAALNALSEEEEDSKSSRSGSVGKWAGVALVASALMAGVYFWAPGRPNIIADGGVALAPQTASNVGEKIERAAQVAGGLASASPVAPAVPQAEHSLSEFRDCATDACPLLVKLPTGRFMMGSPATEAGRDIDESPQHLVDVARAVAIAKFEVTFAEWRACALEGGCKRSPQESNRGGNHPVVNVSWHDARGYAVWLSKKTGQRYRLPSEAEWEYAARAGTSTPFWWGAQSDATRAKFDFEKPYGGASSAKSGVADADPAGTRGSNRFGVADMNGNAGEWVEDCYHPNYQGAPTDQSAWSGACNADRTRVWRGGSFEHSGTDLRAASRGREVADRRLSFIGFRVVREL